MQQQVQAQARQLNAQAALAVQAKPHTQQLQAQLKASMAANKNAANPADTVVPSFSTGSSPLDLILSGAAPPQSTPQPAFTIRDSGNKRRIKKALSKLAPQAAKLVTSISTLDGGKATTRHVVYALPQHVNTVRQMITQLVACGMTAENVSPADATDVDGFTTVSRKRRKSSSLAAKSQAGFSAAVGKAGEASPKRVRGQCDFYTAGLPCYRGDDCKFACYNGPASS